eukprot:m.29198 g.29198  ORF g.29198 m.29198 type:complete len:200 (+) comp11931_c0_seq10:73-672(+)
MGLSKLFHLETQLGFYAQYHHNKMNFALHVLGVPLLLWSAVVLVSQLYVIDAPPAIVEVAASIGLPNFRIHLGLMILSVYAVGYIAMEPFAGLVAATLMLYSGNYALHYAETGDDAMYWATVLQISCWSMQFFGHFVFEGRSPALFDNLFQSLYCAPLFVLLEVMFVVGYRPALAQRIYDNAARDVKAFQAQQKAKKAQ